MSSKVIDIIIKYYMLRNYKTEIPVLIRINFSPRNSCTSRSLMLFHSVISILFCKPECIEMHTDIVHKYEKQMFLNKSNIGGFFWMLNKFSFLVPQKAQNSSWKKIIKTRMTTILIFQLFWKNIMYKL